MPEPSKAISTIIADDDGMTRHALRLVLRELGHEVLAEANDGEKALELCAAHMPHIAFIDIYMPRMNGHQVAERIRQTMPGVGMIMISSVPTLENVQHALSVGVSGFVVKPFNGTRVMEAIEHCLKQMGQLSKDEPNGT